MNISLRILRAIKNRVVFFLIGARLKIRKFIVLWACRGPMPLVGKSLLRLMNWQPVRLGNLSNITSESLTVAPSASSSVLAPEFYKEECLMRASAFLEIQAHELSCIEGLVIATPYSPAILCGKQLYLPDHLRKKYDRVKTDSAEIFFFEKKLIAGTIHPTTTIEEGILIGGAGAFNWYHFAVEILPKLFLAEQLPLRYKQLPLLLPEECKEVSSFAAALKLFSENRPVIFIQRGCSVGVKKLVVFDEVSIGPFNLVPGEWPRVSDYDQHDEVMRCFYTAFRSRLIGDDAALEQMTLPGRKLFLTRPGVRRKYNQQELLDIAIRYGFQSFSPEDMPLHEQAKMFSEADFLIGPSGAAWVGMMFNNRSLKGLSWLPSAYKEFCTYSTMANTLGHSLSFIVAKTEKVLKSTGDAYVSAQEICPIEFEAALKNMLSKK